MIRITDDPSPEQKPDWFVVGPVRVCRSRENFRWKVINITWPCRICPRTSPCGVMCCRHGHGVLLLHLYLFPFMGCHILFLLSPCFGGLDCALFYSVSVVDPFVFSRVIFNYVLFSLFVMLLVCVFVGSHWFLSSRTTPRSYRNAHQLKQPPNLKPRNSALYVC